MFTDGRGQLAISGRQGFIDRTGKVVIEPRYAEARVYSEGLAAVKVGDKWGFIDTAGRMVIEPQFDFAAPFFDGLALVHVGTEDAKTGYVDKTGNYVWKPTN